MQSGAGRSACYGVCQPTCPQSFALPRPLVRHVYVSQIAPGCGAAEIEAIVAHSGPANARRNNTGVIAFDGHEIIQIIEGEESDVDALVAAIAKDKRHTGMVGLDHGPINALSFPIGR